MKLDRQPLHVFFDGQAFRLQSRGGISSSFSALVRTFTRRPELGVVPSIGLRWTSNEHLIESHQVRPYPGLLRHRGSLRLAQPLRLPPAKGLIRTVDRRRLPRAANVVHSTYYRREDSAAVVSALRRGVPHVVSVHDMIPERLPQRFKVNPHADKEWFVRHASAVVCVSESTRRDLIDIYGPLDVPVEVIAHGVDHGVFRPNGRLPEIERPYLLHIGRRDSYKRFDVLLEALSGVEKSVRLVVVGGGSLSHTERQRIQELKLGERIHSVQDASDAEVASLLRGAIAYVSASEMEGFGMPTVEAFACGTPAILPDIVVHREVAGDAGIFFAEGSADSLSAAITGVTHGRGQSEFERGALLKRAQGFSWDRSAELLSDLYRRL